MTRRIKIAEIESEELCVRFIEIGIKLTRPKGKTAAEAMAQFDLAVESGEIPAYIIADFREMARTACEYFYEKIVDARPLQ